MSKSNFDLRMNQTETYSNWFYAEKHPVVDTWPLMSSPVPVLTIVAIYLTFVLKLGPKFIKNRTPYKLKWLIIVYNALAVSLSFATCFIIPGMRWDSFYQLITDGCHPKRSTEFVINMHIASWWYLITKVFELLDTIFFILRKKHNQVTGLHVYHHTTSVLLAWGQLKYVPGEQAIIVAFLNSFVHIFMYTYYMIAAMGPEYHKYLWWKRYITIIQLIQFILDLIYFITLLWYSCDPPKIFTLVFGADISLFVYLFSKFYVNTYLKPQKVKNK